MIMPMPTRVKIRIMKEALKKLFQKKKGQKDKENKNKH